MMLRLTLVGVVIGMASCAAGGGDPATVSPGVDGSSADLIPGTGTGGAAGSRGTGGSAPAALGDTFTRADYAICNDWPPCPPNIIAPDQRGLVRDAASICTPDALGLTVSCGGCIDSASPTCERFVGRCVTRIGRGQGGNGAVSSSFPVSVSACADFVQTASIHQAYVICTGDAYLIDANGNGLNARTVCSSMPP